MEEAAEAKFIFDINRSPMSLSPLSSATTFECCRCLSLPAADRCLQVPQPPPPATASGHRQPPPATTFEHRHHLWAPPLAVTEVAVATSSHLRAPSTTVAGHHHRPLPPTPASG
ncbi:uncharacterized protein LOC122044022 [Zingiber officinale]|uniref:uncharacterized protein LOC122044022 n=1 Tax=Zingiber officinale TaxID=94328 RepID=UPI001C4D4764|nr:uncharacterized protein LOC122044022 [Zingiber officinale]